jgi:hypothetical protein
MTALEFVKKVSRKINQWRIEKQEQAQFASLYKPDPSNFDSSRHMTEAIEWLKRAQDAGADRGVSYGVRFGQDFDLSYPETTGYICQTFVERHLQTGDKDLLRRAIDMGDWEISFQLPEGAVMGGIVNPHPTPAVFNTGMVLLGWAALIHATGQDRYKRAAWRAGDWLVKMQDPDGNWRKGNSQFALSGPTLYNVKAAWGLYEAGLVLGENRFMQAAIRNADYCVAQQHTNGWFPDCCLTDPQKPLLHTLAYTVQGLMGIGMSAQREDLMGAAQKMADAEIRIMADDGFIPGRQDAHFHGTVNWCCLTGSAQMSTVWSDLYVRTRDIKYRDAVRRVNHYLMTHHDIDNADLRLRGGLPGSWPVWGDYGRLTVLNWATKFLVDALIRETQIEKGFS